MVDITNKNRDLPFGDDLFLGKNNIHMKAGVRDVFEVAQIASAGSDDLLVLRAGNIELPKTQAKRMKGNKNPRNLEETRNKKIHQSISEKCQSDYVSQDIHKRTRKGFLSSLPGLFVRSRHPGRQFSVVALQIS